ASAGIPVETLPAFVATEEAEGTPCMRPEERGPIEHELERRQEDEPDEVAQAVRARAGVLETDRCHRQPRVPEGHQSDDQPVLRPTDGAEERGGPEDRDPEQ